MIKTTYLRMLLAIGFLALMLILPSTHLMAQTTEESTSVTSSSRSSTEAQPAQTQSSVTTSTRSTSSTTVSQPAEDLSSVMSSTMVAQAGGEHRCIGYCRHHYEDRLRECNDPGHEHHHRCEEWAREREKECLDKCYRE
jgi:hypothetical protein